MTRHHYVPQFLLRNFTAGGTRADDIWLYSRTDGTFRKTHPQDVCYIDDLYGVDEATVERLIAAGRALGPESVERTLSQIEDGAARAIRRIVRDGRPQGQGDLDWLISYAAIQAVRTPYFMGALASQRDDSLPYSDLLGRMFAEQPKIWDIFKRRRWHLVRTSLPDLSFIITDNPVTVIGPKGVALCGGTSDYERADCDVLVPIGLSLLLVGRWDKPEGVTVSADRQTVALMNSLLMTGLFRDVLLPVPELLILGPDGRATTIRA